MPEGIEIEYYRRAAESSTGRLVSGVDANDGFYLKGATTARDLENRLVGQRFVAARRKGKLLLLDIDGGGTLGLRFGMTGRLVIDGKAAIERLEYSSARDDPGWDRFGLSFEDGGALLISDPRRLGGVELDPDEAALGPDVYSIGAAELTRVLSGSGRALKGRLMDQSRISGLGNLLTDEILWRASLDPARPADSLSRAEIRRLLTHTRRALAELGERGGSHTGDLQPHRFEGAVCPRDGWPLVRRTIAGRTTYSCPRHQLGRGNSTG
jgi:formamidopyrimidine-DNA glycosylase